MTKTLAVEGKKVNSPLDETGYPSRVTLVTALERAKSLSRLQEASVDYRCKLRDEFCFDLRCTGLAFQHILDKCTVPLRRTFDVCVTRLGGLLILTVMAGALIAVLDRQLGWPPRRALFWAGAAGVSLVWVGMRLYIPSDRDLRFRILARSQWIDQVVVERAGAIEATKLARQNFRMEKRRHARIEAGFRSAINRLQMTAWRGMRGVEFENFLAEVLREQGYTVRTTSVTGDQGVDLVVSQGARKIAVQAKGYPLSTVGNGAIQEAHTGMSFYGCQFSAVITNSRFTASAQDLAAKVGCVLIDGDQIGHLIDGRIRL